MKLAILRCTLPAEPDIAPETFDKGSQEKIIEYIVEDNKISALPLSITVSSRVVEIFLVLIAVVVFSVLANFQVASLNKF